MNDNPNARGRPTLAEDKPLMKVKSVIELGESRPRVEPLEAYVQASIQRWKHLRATKVVGSPFAALRLRTAAAKRFKEGRNANGRDLEDAAGAERSFGRLNAPALLVEVAEGATYVDGERRSGATTRPPPDPSSHTLDKSSRRR